jgi:hypothetical protein
MSIPKFNPRIAVLLLIIIVVALLRLASFSGIGPLTLFTPVGAMALFGGAYFKGNIKPFLLPLLTLFISDVIVSFTMFPELRVGLLYAGWYWTYMAFALITLAGKYFIKEINVKNIITAVIVATVIHWLVANVGMCVQENQFTFALYWQKLMSSITYELRFMAGTALFAAMMFGAFEFLQKKFPSLKLI